MLLKISKLFLYAATLSVLVVMTSTFFPFIGGKYYFFRVAVELALACAFFWWGFEATPAAAKEFLGRLNTLARKPLFVAVSLFALTFLLAALFAHDPHGAFWSNFERGDGAFQILHYYAFFVLLVALFDAKAWKILFFVSVAVGVCMIFYGVLGYYQQFSRTMHAGEPGYVAPFCHIELNAAGGKQEKCTPQFITPYQGKTPSTFWHTLTSARFQGSLGNPAYVAPYLLFILFYAAYLSVTIRLGKPELRWTVFGILAAFFLFFFAASGTRGAFFGLIAGIFAFLIYVGILSEKWRPVSIACIAVLLIAGGLAVHMRAYTAVLEGGGESVAEKTIVLPSALGFLFVPPDGSGPPPSARLLDIIPGGRFFDLPLTDNMLWYLGIGVLLIAGCVEFLGHRRYRRLALAGLILIVLGGSFFGYRALGKDFLDQSDGTAQTIRTRLWTWGSAWEGFKERPILGWGPENFSAAFDKHFDTRHFVPGTNAETWFDRAHSVVFDYLTEIGLLGFLAYASMFAVFGWQMVRFALADLKPGVIRAEKKEESRATRKERDRLPEDVTVRGLLVGIIVAYLVQGLALFDVLPIYLNLFIVLAFCCYQFYSRATTGGERAHLGNRAQFEQKI